MGSIRGCSLRGGIAFHLMFSSSRSVEDSALIGSTTRGFVRADGDDGRFNVYCGIERIDLSGSES